MPKLLQISINNRVATYAKRCGDLVCGNSDYEIQFNFDSEWDAYPNRVARFIWGGQYKDVEFTGSTCPVPIISNADSLSVGVYSGNLRTTTSAVIGCRKSILCEGGTLNAEEALLHASRAELAAAGAETSARLASEDSNKAQTAAVEAEVFSSNAENYAERAETAAERAEAVVNGLENLGGTGGGLTATAAALLTAILRNAVFVADQAANITALETELAKTSSGTGGDTGGGDTGGDTGGGDTGGDTGGGDDTGDGDVITYTITNNLTNVSTNNAAKSVTANSAYGATLTPTDGLYVGEVTVTMGGVDITNTAYADGRILITAVTGDVVITASATEWGLVRVLYSDDLLYRTATNFANPNSTPPYTLPQDNRTGYLLDDLKVETGYIYKIEFASTVDTIRMGVMGFTEAAVENMSNKKVLVNTVHIYDFTTEWSPSGFEFEVPDQFNGSPIDHMRLTFRMSANNEVFELGCISEVIITRKAVE